MNRLASQFKASILSIDKIRRFVNDNVIEVIRGYITEQHGINYLPQLSAVVGNLCQRESGHCYLICMCVHEISGNLERRLHAKSEL